MVVPVLCAAALLAGFSPRADATDGPTVISPETSPIEHVVIIYQENLTFDAMLGETCQTRVMPCDGYTGPVTLANGTTIQNGYMPDVVPMVSHSTPAQQDGIAGNWDRIVGCKPKDNYACISHIDPSTMPNFTSLANEYALSDRSFAAGEISSYLAHIELAAGQLNGMWGRNPFPSKTGAPLGPGWGCPSNRDIQWGVGFQPTLTYEPACIPLPDGSGAYRETKVPHVQSLMEQLESGGVSWHIYVGVGKRAPEAYNWNICSYFAWCQQNRTSKVSTFSTFMTDARKGTLADVSLIPATSKWSQHNGTSISFGDNYVGDLVGAAMEGPDWMNTAVFIAYDDCGCFYDHVTPPQGLGFRNPVVIVSPWAKPHWTDSNQANQPLSMLNFIDRNFGLPPLTPAVGESYDYADSFDFSTPVVDPPPTMVHTPVSAETRQRVRELRPTWADDPT